MGSNVVVIKKERGTSKKKKQIKYEVPRIRGKNIRGKKKSSREGKTPNAFISIILSSKREQQ